MMDETQLSSATTKGIISSQLGARLKAAREAMNLSEKDAAGRLHLSVKFIGMMENGNFEDGLPTTFMRGYLRSYARLVNIVDGEINAALEQLETNPASPTSAPVSPILLTTTTKNSDRYIRWITYVIAMILIALVGTWWSSHSRYAVSDVSPKTLEAQPAAPAPTEPKTETLPADSTPAPTPTVAAPTPGLPAVETPVVSAPITHPAIEDSPAVKNPLSQTNTPPSPPASVVATPPVASNPESTSGVAITSGPIDSAAVTDMNDESAKPAPRKKYRTRRIKMAQPEPGLDGGGEDFSY